MPFVLAAARRERAAADLPDGQDDLAHPRLPSARHAVLHRFETTTGGRFEGVVDDPIDLVDLVLDLVRAGSWLVGLGAAPSGPAGDPSTRGDGGPAATFARQALDRAARRPQRLAVLAADRSCAEQADAVLTLLATVVQRRSVAAWQAVDLVAAGLSVTRAAELLGVSRQAVGQRLATGLWPQEQRARPVAARLLAVLTGPTPVGPTPVGPGPVGPSPVGPPPLGPGGDSAADGPGQRADPAVARLFPGR
jgi:hypothetical protein